MTLQIGADGRVSLLPGVKTFPFTKNKVLGKRHSIMAPKVMSE